jgi:PadR family transcriptional regulator, regulatory protein AphA
MSPKRPQPLTLELGLLGYLRPGPLHGYQIHQRLLEPDGPGMVWRIKQAQLYAHLEKLEENSLIQSTLQAQETRPTRRVYRLTKDGQYTYDLWLRSPVNTPRQIRQEFMVKLYFAQRENQHTVHALIDNQLSVCQGWLEMHQGQLAAAPSGSFSGVVLNYRLGQIYATLGWLQQIKADLSI